MSAKPVEIEFTDAPQRAPRHSWPKEGEDHYTRTLPIDSKDGNERIEKVCKKCGMTRITLIPPFPERPWHEWKTRAGVLWQGELTPPCLEAK